MAWNWWAIESSKQTVTDPVLVMLKRSVYWHDLEESVALQFT